MPIKDHRFRAGILEIEDRIAPETADALRRLGHKVQIIGPFMKDTGTTLAGFDAVQDGLRRRRRPPATLRHRLVRSRIVTRAHARTGIVRRGHCRDDAAP